jgi:hypothetical protein
MLLSISMIIYYIVVPLFKNESNDCIRFTKKYGIINNFIRSIDISNNIYNNNLHDYYIKSAYNCCNGGSYSNGYVSLCVLENIIKQGVRCLDFEIFSRLDEPIIASSILKTSDIKQTVNHINLIDVLTTIKSRGFSDSYSPNHTDPIILNFRIKSSNEKMYEKMGTYIKMLNEHLLGNEY